MTQPQAHPDTAGARPGVSPLRRALLAASLIALAASARGWAEYRLAHWNDPTEALTVVRRGARPAVPSAPRASVRRLVFLLLDGVRARDAPKLPGGFATLDAGVPSMSRPGYHRMMTGVPSWASGVRSNRFAGRARLPTLLDEVRRAGLRPTFLADQVDWVSRMLGPSAVPPRLGADFERAFARSLAANDLPGSAVFAHFCGVDHAAHDHGRQSGPYRRALRTAWRLSREAFEATDPGRDLVAIVSDHGHVERGGHGGAESEARSAFLVLRGPRVSDGVRTRGTLEQVGPTIAAAMGIPPPRAALAPPLKPLVPHVKEDAPGRRARIAPARAALPPDRWRVRTVVAFSAALLALLALVRRRGAAFTIREIALACAPLAAFALFHALQRGGPSLSAIRAGTEYQLWMAGWALLAYAAHAALVRDPSRILAAVAVSTAPLVAVWARLGVAMGSDLAHPAWPYIALVGVAPVAASCVVAAVFLVVSGFLPSGTRVRGRHSPVG